MDATVDSPQAWRRLVVALALMTVGSSAMYVVAVVLPSVQAEFGTARADASLPYTLGYAAGTVIADRYRIEAEIGHGGMAIVYRAQDLELSESVALKLFRALPQDDQGIVRFRQELK